MAKLTEAQSNMVFSLIRSALNNLLELGVKYRLHKYIIDEKQRDWRELEFELHAANYPVKGIGIIATREETVIHDEEDVGSEEISPFANQIPFDAAMASYAFTILESCGDDVVAIVNPSFSKIRAAWHRLIPGNPNELGDDPLAESEKFAEPFGLLPNRSYASAVVWIAQLKQARNAFAHRGSEVSFEEFYRLVLLVAIKIFFANLPTQKELKMFPFSLLDPKWQ